MTDRHKPAVPERDYREKREVMLAAVLETFPVEVPPPYGFSDLYQEITEEQNSTYPLGQLKGFLSARMSLVVRSWRKFLDRQMRRRGQSMVRWQTLYEIAATMPAVTLKQTAARTGVTSAALVGLLDELEADGLLTRSVDESDRRSKLIALTAAGEDVVRDLSLLATHSREELLAGVTDSEIRITLDVLRMMAKNLEGMTRKDKIALRK